MLYGYKEWIFLYDWGDYFSIVLFSLGSGTNLDLCCTNAQAEVILFP